MLGISRVIDPTEYVLWSLLVNANENVVPLSSSPLPANAIPELNPIGLPVVVPSFDTHVAVAPPDTDKAPACAAETEARDPHNADNPTFVNLFIIIYISFLKR